MYVCIKMINLQRKKTKNKKNKKQPNQILYI